MVNGATTLEAAARLETTLDVIGNANFNGSLSVNGNIIFNDQALATGDFRAEGDTATHLLFLDASADNIGINTATPSTFKLEVAGNIGPDANGTRDLGSAARKFQNIYTQVLNADTLTLSFTKGSIIHADVNGNLAQDNAGFYFDYTNNFVGIGGATPAAGLDIGNVTTTHTVNGATDMLVAGSIEIDTNLFVDQNALLNGATAIVGAAGLSSTLTVNGATELEGAALIGGNTGLAGTLTVNGATELEGAALVTGAMGLASTLTVNGATELEGAALIGGNTGLAGTLMVNGATTLEAAARLETTLDVIGNANFNGSMSVNGNFIFNDQSLATNDLRIEGDSTTHLVFVDASTDNIGINDASPGARLEVNGTVAYTPSASTNITAAGGITATRALMRVQGSPGAVNITANPQIADGTDGQILVLKGMHDTNTVTLDNGTGISLTSGASFTLGNKDTITLIYDALDDEWIEISRSNK